MKKNWLIFFTFFFTLLDFSFAEEENAHLVGFQVPRFVEDENTGEFVKLAKTVAKRAGIKLKISIAPPQRAILMLRQGVIDGYFPGLNELKNFSEEFKTSDSVPYYFKKDYLFFNKENVKLALTEKKLCLTTGYPYDQSFVKKHKFKVEFSPSDVGCLKMLALKRVDYFMCELMSGFSALNKLNPKVRSSIDLRKDPIASLPVFFTFADTEKGRRLSSKFSKVLKQMRKNKELSKLFEPVKKLVGEKYQFTYDPSIP